MTRGRRRSTRSTAQRSSEASPISTRSHTPEEALSVLEQSQEPSTAAKEGETCPACSSNVDQPSSAFEKEKWIRCDVCKTWYHWRCVENGEDVDTIDKWYCKKCLAADDTRGITFKAPARKSSRKRTQRDYANLNSGIASDPSRWTRMLEGKAFCSDPFKRMKGSDVGISWLEEDDALLEPIIIENPEGLVDDIAEIVGGDTPVEVIDVASQSTSPGWTLGKWAEYFDLEPSRRDKILNVISLEVSGTKLSDMILPPRIVRELDWVENFWPSTRKGKGHVYPKVQLYCLMGVATAWTDWHIDFAGSSVYYHILSGSKVFYFIKPTPANLAAYERWSGTELQNHAWLGDMADEVYKVELTQGNTMIIPTGWIHAVYTPVDTLVFGGNFLHSYNVATQLRVRNIEIVTQVPKKFRFPMFSRLCWYVGDKYLRDFKGHSNTALSSRVLSSLLALAEFLVSEARILERGSDQAKKEAKDQIPADRIKDAPAMARELRWRVKLASGYQSEEESQVRTRKSKDRSPADTTSNGFKRRRVDSGDFGADSGRFRNFKPKAWDGLSTTTESESTRKTTAPRPGGEDDGWVQGWLDINGYTESMVEDEAKVESVREVTVKVRRSGKGVERQRIERVVENWTWAEPFPVAE
ncbi:jumonji superfamily protein [Crucibulum laeve]|uniref:JmjC domain-containing histone demethylation protein 1 n=1 Tax=Crucibulum laeve TaxID=68775 RepID=A0A5C3MD71_9AGAR|nr:jumonji superfamily protein [Crucibulum laeve]